MKLLFETLWGDDDDPMGTPLPLRAVSDAELRAKPIAVLEDDGLIPVTERRGRWFVRRRRHCTPGVSR